MFKHRDNVMHPPATIDPHGAGASTVLPSTMLLSAASGNLPSTLMPSAPAAAAGTAKAATRKRGRDIRGLDRFRQVVFGDQGFPRLHAMVARNPDLMYPPSGVEEARERVTAAASAAALRPEGAFAEQLDDASMWAMFESERATAEKECAGTLGETGERGPATTVTMTNDQPNLNDTTGVSLSEKELANYHHVQLDAFLRLLYEFNHLTFVKLPMSDTLQLLGRCGKEVVAHVMEFDMQARMQREGRVREMRKWYVEEEELKKRRVELAEAEQARALAEAEEFQIALEAEAERHQREEETMRQPRGSASPSGQELAGTTISDGDTVEASVAPALTVAGGEGRDESDVGTVESEIGLRCDGASLRRTVTFGNAAASIESAEKSAKGGSDAEPTE